EETRRVAQREWHTSDIAEFQTTVDATRNGSAHPSVRSLIPRLVGSPDGRTLALTLAEIHTEFCELDRTLATLLAEHGQFDFDALADTLAALREELSNLPELMPLLLEITQLPE